MPADKYFDSSSDFQGHLDDLQPGQPADANDVREPLDDVNQALGNIIGNQETFEALKIDGSTWPSLEITRTDDLAAPVVEMVVARTVQNGPIFRSKFARLDGGGQNAAAQNSDNLFRLEVYAHDSMEYQANSVIRVRAVGDQSTSNQGSKIELRATPEGATAPNTVLVIRGDKLLPGEDDAFDIGGAAYRWNEIYAKEGVINTSDQREKRNIQPIPPQTALQILALLQPATYMWKDRQEDAVIRTETRHRGVTQQVPQTRVTYDEASGKWIERTVMVEVPITEAVAIEDEDGNVLRTEQRPVMEAYTEEVVERPAVNRTHNRLHTGFIAQQVAQVLTDAGLAPADYGVFIYNEDADRYGLRYTEFIALMVAAFQAVMNLPVLRTALEAAYPNLQMGE